EPGVTYECNLNSAGWAPCSANPSFTAIEGSNTLEVRATDLAGNTTDADDYASWTWTVDTTEPETAIASGPSSPVNQTTADFEFESPDDATATFECRLDAGAWAPCAANESFPGLAEGAHVLYVRAVDPAGNRDQTPAQHSWTIDLTAPIPTITNGPAPLVATTEASFVLTADEPGVTYECNLNSAGWAPCNANPSFTAVEGSNTLEVRATDLAGNTTDPADYASWTWTVDTTEPNTTIVAGPQSPVNQTTAEFEFESPDDATATFECRLDAGAWA